MLWLHGHAPGENQCTSALVKHIKAPVHLVWSLVRSFDQPQWYKLFVSRFVVRGGDLEIGSVRGVNVKTGLQAKTSTERLEQLDDDEHILSVKFFGGDHRLRTQGEMSVSPGEAAGEATPLPEIKRPVPSRSPGRAATTRPGGASGYWPMPATRRMTGRRPQ
ncbi:ABA receptor 5 [Hordeum vulgare]|nr:ABA receptor 5 [Hordeum vulgare]